MSNEHKLFSPKDESGREHHGTSVSRPATKEDLNRMEERVTVALGVVLAAAERILRTERQIMATLDDVLTEVAEESTVDDSIVALLENIKAQLDAAGGNQAKIDQIFAGLQANKAKLAAALLAGTPSAPPTPPT